MRLTRRVSATCSPASTCIVSVTDTGTGMAPDVLGAGVRAVLQHQGVEAGSGLGLAMVHGFVKQSGRPHAHLQRAGPGYDCQNLSAAVCTPPKPLAAIPAPAARPAARAACQAATKRSSSSRTTTTSAATPAARSRNSATQFIQARDAAEALRIAADGARIDLLFTDVVLPGGVSGRQLSDNILKLRPDLPVLFTTGYTRNAIVHHGRLDPDVQLLNKPYTQQDLLRKVRELLDRKPAAKV